MARTLQTHRRSGATKTARPKVESHHPKYAEMINEAIVALKNRKGSSRVAILKYIEEHYDIHADQSHKYVSQALKHGVETGALKQVKGIGSNGSFKIGENSTASKKKTTDSAKAKKNDVGHSTASAAGKSSTPKKAGPGKSSVGSTPKNTGAKSGKKTADATPKKAGAKSGKKTAATKK